MKKRLPIVRPKKNKDGIISHFLSVFLYNLGAINAPVAIPQSDEVPM
jgi:hypothetical protein